MWFVFWINSFYTILVKNLIRLNYDSAGDFID